MGDIYVLKLANRAPTRGAVDVKVALQVDLNARLKEQPQLTAEYDQVECGEAAVQNLQ